MILFDTHCHLQDPAFDEDRESVYQTAVQQGIGILIPGYTLASSAAAVSLASRWSAAWAMVGIHPHEAADLPPAWLDALADAAQASRVVAVGEIGLDYYRDWSPRSVQQEVFRAQLDLAVALGLPVSVHSRDAEADTVAAIRASGIRGGVMHCFLGSYDMACQLLDLGFYLSVAGPVTFKSGQAIRELVAKLPSDRLLVETDAPYMAPVPHRGHRNEPQWVLSTAEAVALAKNMDPKEAFSIFVSNTYDAFRRLDRTRESGQDTGGRQ